MADLNYFLPVRVYAAVLPLLAAASSPWLTVPSRAQAPISLATPAADAAAEATFAAAQQLYKQNKIAEAGSRFADFVGHYSNNPQVPEATYLQGFCLLKTGQPETAIAAWNRLVQRFPTSPRAADALEQLAHYYESNRNPTKAAELTDQLIRSYPKHPASIRLGTQQAEALFRAGKIQESVRMFETFGDQLPPAARQTLNLARTRLGAAADPGKLLVAARQRMAEGDFTAAAKIWESYLREQPTGPGALQAKTELGWCVYVDGKPEQVQRAEGLWAQVVAAGPPGDEWVAMSRWHQVQLLAGPRAKWQEAVNLCGQIAAGAPTGSFRHEQALYTSAWLLWAHQQYPQALEGFRRLIKAYPAKAEHPPIVQYLADCETRGTDNPGKDRK